MPSKGVDNPLAIKNVVILFEEVAMAIRGEPQFPKPLPEALIEIFSDNTESQEFVYKTLIFLLKELTMFILTDHPFDYNCYTMSIYYFCNGTTTDPMQLKLRLGEVFERTESYVSNNFHNILSIKSLG